MNANGINTGAAPNASPRNTDIAANGASSRLSILPGGCSDGRSAVVAAAVRGRVNRKYNVEVKTEKTIK